jgi:lysophospholipase L1-like esterase
LIAPNGFKCRYSVIFEVPLSHPLLSRTAQALYTLSGILLLMAVVPKNKVIMRWNKQPLITTDTLRVWQPYSKPVTSETPPVLNVPAPIESVGEVQLAFDTKESPKLAEPGAKTTPDKPTLFGGTKEAPDLPIEFKKPPRPIEDPSGHAMDAFFEHLYQVEHKKPGSIARITYYGDSVIATDWVTSTLRRKMQTQFGDAGHGFILVANAWQGYSHKGLSRYASKGWSVSRVVGPWTKDGLYGLGGVSFTANAKGLFATFGTAKAGKLGRAVSRFTLTYANMPKGGKFTLKLDKEEPQVIDTASETATPKAITVKAPDGAHSLEVKAVGDGPVRMFGMELERDVPGVVVDSIGIIGCRLRFLDKIDDDHWASELKRRDPSLIIFGYGANESGDGFAYPMDKYEETARAVLTQAKKALPNASCLIFGPLDAARKVGDSYTTKLIIPALTKVQKKLAEELKCGFFNTYEAMGGFGSMAVWLARGLGGHDLTHPTDSGAEVLGNWLYGALMQSYGTYKKNRKAP